MIHEDTIKAAIPKALAQVDIPERPLHRRGKVRDIYVLPDGCWAFVTTDRLSAFDRVLGLIPYKGQVLNQLAAWWFAQLGDIVAHHLVATPDPNVSVVRPCRPLPVEVIVRGYLTGVTRTSLWTLYAQGERVIYGIRFPDGLRKNEPLPEPVITPTTKGGPTGHDERLTAAEVVERGLVPADLWEQVQEVALALFRRGQEIAANRGLILVDTKYEFGVDEEGNLVLIDEVHTPDSSRFWRADTYEERLARGEEPESMDKEFVRLWFAQQGYRGNGEPPALPEDVIVGLASRYIAVYEMLTGRPFVPATYPAEERVRAAVLAYAA